MKLWAVKMVPPTLAACVGGLLILLWVSSGSTFALQLRLPLPNEAVHLAAPAQVVDISGFHVAGTGRPADVHGAWPRFRGQDCNAVSKESVTLVRNFPPQGPAVLWTVDLGEGYAGAAVLDGRLYVLDYDQQAKADTLRCLSLTDGREIWRRGYYVTIKRNHGMSRTVPAVTDKYVVTIGPKCHALCADAKTGKYLWGIDLAKQYGATVPDWYTGQCPLIDQDRAIIAPGGSALMIAVDCQSGKVVWETPNPDGWLMTHSSIMPMTLGGARMYVYCASGGVAGISAETGRTLWSTAGWTVNMSNTPSPIVVGDGRLFLSGGYGAGSMMIQIVEQDGKFAVRELFRLKPDVFGSEQHTPVFYDGHIYGVKDNGQLVCLDPSGKVVWTSGTSRFGGKGRGPYLIADGMILILTAQGVLWLVEATPAAFRPLASRSVLTGPEAWAPMALAGGRLIVRDLTGMMCLDMRAEVTAKVP